jgi:hypothetical protein
MKTIITLLIMAVSNLGFAQNIYLKISEENKTSVSYPPGTTFELKNKHGYIILKESETPLIYKIDESYTLTVFPTYKKEKDVYNLINGKIELISNAEYIIGIPHEKSVYQSYGVSLDKTTYSSSTINKGESNVVLEFSNNVVFYYTDGDVRATLNSIDVEIKGKFLIYSESGVVKISFNPKNKDLWWTYEPMM